MANASGFRGPKQTNGYFVPLADCRGAVLNYSGAAGAGGSFLPGTFTSASTTLAAFALSSISSLGAGGLMRDMGKTVVSSNRTFRKVQVVGPSLNGGVFDTTATGTQGYQACYIELATGNAWASNANPAKVAYLPGLL
jgi:hypothetical protein